MARCSRIPRTTAFQKRVGFFASMLCAPVESPNASARRTLSILKVCRFNTKDVGHFLGLAAQHQELPARQSPHHSAQHKVTSKPLRWQACRLNSCKKRHCSKQVITATNSISDSRSYLKVMICLLKPPWRLISMSPSYHLCHEALLKTSHSPAHSSKILCSKQL